MIRRIELNPGGPGLHEFTDQAQSLVQSESLHEGLCTLFIRHTSASLLIQENADPAVCRDLEAWLGRLVSEGDPLYTHTAEGPDDMPAHIRSALTCSSLSIPIARSRLALGTWQGIYLWEHRHAPGPREIIVHIAR